jgi:signal transduction histidine kinase
MFQSSLAKNAPPERIQTDLSQISETARELVRNMDEIVWAINPENNTLDGLTTYLGKYVQDYLTAAKLRCRLDLPPEVPDIIVPSEIRHNVYLSIKEALNNVVKHARAKEVLFQLRLEPQAFAFIIKDDGVGLGGPIANGDGQPSLRASSGHGLKNLPRRLESVAGTCTVSSEPGQGTKIELFIPYKSLQNRTIKSQTL